MTTREDRKMPRAVCGVLDALCRMRRQRIGPVILVVGLLIPAGRVAAAGASAQTLTFDDYVRDLRSPDALVRVNALRTLRETKAPEAIAPLAALVTDPVDEIQLEAIDTELSFFLSRDIVVRRRVALVVEVRGRSRTATAFEEGILALQPRQTPLQLVRSLTEVLRDDNRRVRLDAVYLLGVVAQPPIDKTTGDRLIEMLADRDAEMRIAAARVIGRLRVGTAADALIGTMNDADEEVRSAAMRALGDIREKRAVQALTERLEYYGRGREAKASMDALARIGETSSVPLFKTRLGDPDTEMRRLAAEGIGRTDDRAAAAELEAMIGVERSDEVRLAMSFALQRSGRPYLHRVVGSLTDRRLTRQAVESLVEIGSPAAPELTSYLQDPDPVIRAYVADVLGVIGNSSIISALEAARRDRDRAAAAAAERAVSRIRLLQDR